MTVTGRVDLTGFDSIDPTSVLNIDLPGCGGFVVDGSQSTSTTIKISLSDDPNAVSDIQKGSVSLTYSPFQADAIFDPSLKLKPQFKNGSPSVVATLKFKTQKGKPNQLQYSVKLYGRFVIAQNGGTQAYDAGGWFGYGFNQLGELTKSQALTDSISVQFGDMDSPSYQFTIGGGESGKATDDSKKVLESAAYKASLVGQQTQTTPAVRAH